MKKEGYQGPKNTINPTALNVSCGWWHTVAPTLQNCEWRSIWSTTDWIKQHAKASKCRCWNTGGHVLKPFCGVLLSGPCLTLIQTRAPIQTLSPKTRTTGEGGREDKEMKGGREEQREGSHSHLLVGNIHLLFYSLFWKLVSLTGSLHYCVYCLFLFGLGFFFLQMQLKDFEAKTWHVQSWHTHSLRTILQRC